MMKGMATTRTATMKGTTETTGTGQQAQPRRMKAQDNEARTGTTRGQGCNRMTNKATSMGRGMGRMSAGDEEHNTGPMRPQRHL
jgi:hypothetical protein